MKLFLIREDCNDCISPPKHMGRVDGNRERNISLQKFIDSEIVSDIYIPSRIDGCFSADYDITTNPIESNIKKFFIIIKTVACFNHNTFIIFVSRKKRKYQRFYSFLFCLIGSLWEKLILLKQHFLYSVVECCCMKDRFCKVLSDDTRGGNIFSQECHCHGSAEPGYLGNLLAHVQQHIGD